MAYEDVAALTVDQEYQARLGAALMTEALGKPGDALADALLAGGPFLGQSWFGPAVAASPGFGDKFATGGQSAITDGDLLSAVQANWTRMAGLHAPAA
jgi:hypothetical protein